MTPPKQADPPTPAKITEVRYEPVEQRQGGHDDRFWADGDGPHRRPPLSFSGRMFNVGWKGWVRLVLICVFIGAIFQAGAFNPFAPGFTIGAGLGQIVNGVVNIAAWAAQLGAMPLLLGAIVVIPVWLMWRAVLALFNRDKPPGPEDRILPKQKEKRR